MTALAAYWRLDGRPGAAEACARMLAAQEIYGPHAGAQWSDGPAALGRRLMRTLPEDDFDRQPLVGGGGRYVLVADLRLDNRDELRAALGIPEKEARQSCDAAILLGAIERWGERCFERLLGDFAVALWDGQARRLLLARDPLGQRPLHYHRGANFLAVASMPKGLHALPDVPYGPDEERVAEFLVLMPERGPRTFFRDIARVEPGHVVALSPDATATRRYWRPNIRPIRLSGPDEYAEAARAQLDDAVRRRLRGQSTIGAQLSGGLDSAGVAATAARMLAPAGGRVVAFTSVPRAGYAGAAPPGRFVGEGALAAATAALYANIEHVLVPGPGRSPLDDLDRAFLLCQTPVLNVCNLAWLDAINDAARDRQLSVLLVGARGNLGLSYEGYALLPELARAGRLLAWRRAAGALVAARRMRWRRALALTVGPWVPAAPWRWFYETRRGEVMDVFGYSAIARPAFAAHGLAARARARALDLVYRPWTDSVAERLWALGRFDPGMHNKGTLGGWRLDMRDPTADIRLIEFCLGVPSAQFLSDGAPRALARGALADRLPRAVLDSRLSGLQAADWHERLGAERDALAEEIVRLKDCPEAARTLDLPRLARLVEAWPDGGWEREDVAGPYRYALLRAISAGHFLRRTTGANR